jgi:hypothetical protein
MSEQRPKTNENEAVGYSLSELYKNSGKIVRNVLRTQEPATISEYGQAIAEIRPLPRRKAVNDQEEES